MRVPCDGRSYLSCGRSGQHIIEPLTFACVPLNDVERVVGSRAKLCDQAIAPPSDILVCSYVGVEGDEDRAHRGVIVSQRGGKGFRDAPASGKADRGKSEL